MHALPKECKEKNTKRRLDTEKKVLWGRFLARVKPSGHLVQLGSLRRRRSYHLLLRLGNLPPGTLLEIHRRDRRMALQEDLVAVSID